MKFFEHINKIDEIVSAHKEEENKKQLFHTAGVISGAGLNLTNISMNGNKVTVCEDTPRGFQSNTYSIFESTNGITIM